MRVIISGGGTGGHIFPAISIANEIKQRFPDSEILFVGANDRMEMTKVPAAGYSIVGLSVAGFYRKKLWKNFAVLWKLFKSLRKAKRVLKKFQPDIAIGVGGYASGPTLRVANRMGVPTLLHEGNSYAGVTNKILAKKADKICVAYDNMERFFPAKRIVMTGNPCRQDLISSKITKAEAIKHFNLNPNKRTILVIGGSLGSRTINNSIVAGVKLFKENNIQVIWQCGGSYFFELSLKFKKTGDNPNIHLHEFINRMDLAYKTADLVVSRAGASSISELCLLKKAVILIPSPNVSEDHQTQNALALVNKGAAIMIKDIEAEKKLAQIAVETINSVPTLNKLSENISKLAEHNSAGRIVDIVERIVEKRRRKHE